MDDTGQMLPARWTRRGAALLGILLLAGCATRVSTHTPPTAAEMPNPPTRVFVADFAVDPASVRQDEGIGLRLQRQLSGDNQDVARVGIANEVQSAIGDTLVAGLAKAGLPVRRMSAGVNPVPGDLLVTGRVLRIDQGNRTRRLGIGFGAGKSIVEAVAELHTIRADGTSVLLQSYDGSADSGRKPGMAVGASMAVSRASPVMGAVSGVTNIGGEVRRSPVGKEAASLGNRLATEIGQFAAERGWIAAASVSPWTR